MKISIQNKNGRALRELQPNIPRTTYTRIEVVEAAFVNSRMISKSFIWQSIVEDAYDLARNAFQIS